MGSAMRCALGFRGAVEHPGVRGLAMECVYGSMDFKQDRDVIRMIDFRRYRLIIHDRLHKCRILAAMRCAVCKVQVFWVMTYTTASSQSDQHDAVS